MEKVFSSIELEQVAYFPQPDGTAIVYLRANIERDAKDNDDGTGYEFWTADEVEVRTDIAEDEVVDNFDQLWALGEEQEYRRARAKMPDEEWRGDIDSALLDIMEVMA